MKKDRREFAIAAMGALVGMISIVILLKENGHFVPEIVPKIIMWFAYGACAIILILYIIEALMEGVKPTKQLDKKCPMCEEPNPNRRSDGHISCSECGYDEMIINMEDKLKNV